MEGDTSVVVEVEVVIGVVERVMAEDMKRRKHSLVTYFETRDRLRLETHDRLRPRTRTFVFLRDKRTALDDCFGFRMLVRKMFCKEMAPVDFVEVPYASGTYICLRRKRISIEEI